jgi:hypothetical protein
MLQYASRLLRLASVRIKHVPSTFRAHSSAVESRYANKIQQRLAEYVLNRQAEKGCKRTHLNLK